MEARALCPSWAKQGCPCAPGGASSSTALLWGVLLLCSLSPGSKPEGAVPVKPVMMGLKATPPKQWGARRCRADSGTGKDRGLAYNKEGAGTLASEGAGAEGFGGGKRMSTATRARCRKRSEQAPALEEATPCLASCLCTSLAVNCSGAGLAEVPLGEPCSWRVTLLDLSHNHLSKVREEELAGYPSLQVLDLSYNCIRTIEEGAFRHLGSLQSLKLVSNSLVCSCSLRWLVAWVREKGPLVSNTERLHCFEPTTASSVRLLKADFSALICADAFISCVKDPETRKDTVLHYSYIHPGRQNQASCYALCYQKAHTHYGLDLEDRCLCGSLGGKGAVDCGQVCSNEIRSRVCNKTVVHAVSPVQGSPSLSARPRYSLHEVIEFTAETLLPGTLYVWDFGDGGEQFNSSSPRARHTYALPGLYVVTVRVQVGRRSLLHRAAVSVILPVGPVGIECPRAVGRGESINLWLHTQQGTDLSVLWRMKTPSGQETLDDSSCPQGGRILLQNRNCYWLSHAKETWADARRLCQGTPGGDLAVVRTREVQSFLQKTFSGAGVVWIGLSSLRWVDGSLVDSFQNWTPFGRPEGKESCVQMHLLDSEGVWSRSPCSAKSLFLCERRAGAPLPIPDLLLTGVPVFSGVYDVENVSTHQLPPLRGPDRIELMLFPGLWFSHAGTLVSVDFGIQETKKPVLVRFQILRPHCNANQHLVPPGCEFLHTPFACCHPQPLCNTTGWCPSGQQWCPLSKGCLNISSPCSSYAFENVTSSILPIQNPPRYRGTPPFYSPVAVLSLLLTASSENRHVHVLLPREEISVYPDDVIGIQHNAEVSSLLHCLQHSHSPWRQSYISLVKDGWWEGRISSFTNPSWVDHVVCDLQVTFVCKTQSFAAPPLLGRHLERGAYTYTATVQNAVSSRQVNCTVEVQTEVSGLQIIHPMPVNGKLNVATKRKTLVVIKILSGCNATAHWTAPVDRTGVLFEATCPNSIVAHVSACHRDTADTLFSSALLHAEEPKTETLNVLVSNEISSQKLSVKIQSYNAIEGLRVVLPGSRRMLVDVSQVFSAELTQGSSVSYNWVIDNMDMFAYNGQTYSVKFKRPATYQLKLRAENPVSSETVEVALTAEAMNPLANPELVGIPGVVAVDTPQTLVFKVDVDTAMEVTVRWGFGDGSPEVESRLSPPYDSQLSHPDPQGERVQVLARVTHTYTQPGNYSVTAEAINRYDRVERLAEVHAVCPMTSVAVLVSPASPLVNEDTQFEALPRPSAYGAVYSWDFNDSSPTQEGAKSSVRHSFETSGVYNVRLRANNGLSDVQSEVAVMVSEGVTGLRVVASAPTELGSATVVHAMVDSGPDVLWTFNMGDGSVYSNLNLSFVSHTFAQEGNYTVTVRAHNAATSTCASTVAEVYRLQITNILAPSCLSSGELTHFQAVVSGPSKGLQFSWDFQDGKAPSVRHGDPAVFHSYPVAGSYQLNLTVRGIVSTVSHQLAICVEDRIRLVKLVAPTLAVALGEPTCFQAEVVPVPGPQHQYRYHWDFGVGEEPVPSGSPEITFTYLEGGSYRVMVTVWNAVSRQNASADLLVQRAIGTVSILHSSETGSFLALGTSYLFTAQVPWDAATAPTFLWDFGDHSPLQGDQSVSHTYHTAGDVTVTVTGENQVNRRSASLDVTVLVPVQQLALSAERPVAEVRQEVAFQASLAAGDRARYLWAIGEPRGFQEGATTFSHTFPAAGLFMVFVTAENSVSREQANVTIEVQERVQGVRIHSRDVVQGRYLASAEPFMLTAEVTQGSNVTFRWGISRGLRRVFATTGQSLMFCYNASGELLVEVRAGNVLGEVATGLALQVVERACGVTVQAASDSTAVGEPVNLTVSVTSGTDLLYSWHIEERAQPLLTNSSCLSYTYSTLGSKLVFVTVSNVLGSSNGSTQLRIQEPVSSVSFTVEGSTPPFFLKSDASRQLQGSVAAGSDVVWEWQVQRNEKQQLFRGQNISCEFSAAGVYHVSLRAWNDVSKDMTQHPVAVQDPVAGLAVEVDRQDVCTDDQVTFMLHTLRGTNVSFALSVPSLGLSLEAHGGTRHFSFPVAGSHWVLASASNNVSTQVASVVVRVLEKVRGLHIPNCCPAVLKSNQELVLTARVRAGENITFFWIFQLPGHPAYEAAGQQVEYMPPGAGNLTVRVEASNPFCAASLTVTVTLQEPIEAATLSSNGTRAFVNQTVAFDVAVLGGSDLRSEWQFGDSEAAFAGGGDRQTFHCYGQAGDFLVQVKIYNEVSFVLVQTTVTVRELGCDSPTVRLVEPPSSVPKSRNSYFEASVDLKGCTAYKALYLWEVFSSPHCEHLAEANQVSLEHVDRLTPALTLPKLSLDIGTHCLRFTASLQDTPLARTLSWLITVTPSKLVPLIRGGSWRSWSARLDLVLDGSGSYDPDVGTDTAPSLEYHWGCENVSLPRCAIPPLQGGARVTVPRTVLCRGAGYRFVLTVKKPGKEPASVAQTVWIEASQILPVTVECRSCSALSSYEVSRSIHVTLAGQCQGCDNRTMYKWIAHSSDGQPLTLDHVTTSTGDSNRDLVIRQGVLQDGVNYTFTVSASQPGGELQGGSSITLTPNNPPKGGVCSLTPEHNLYLLETLVSYQCTGWVDEDSSPAQLIYTLIADRCSPDGRHCQHFCLYRGIKSSFSTLLPAATGATVNVRVELEDSQGAKTLALNRTLTLAMPALAGFQTVTSWLKNKSQSELWAVVQQGNPQEVIPYSLALITVLNQHLGNQSDEEELRDRIAIRSNVTAALASLNISSVKEVAQLSAALQQCVAFPGELSPESQARTLAAAQRMIQVIGSETEEGHETPTAAGTSILGILGSTFSALDRAPHLPLSGGTGRSVALTAFNLTRALMKSLMRSRVLNEETLLLSVPEIHTQGKRADSLNLLCLAPSQPCLFSVPRAVAGQLAGSQEVVQVLMDLSVNPFPFNYSTNSSISTRLALLEFTTPGGAPIPVASLPRERAIGLRLPTGQQEQWRAPQTLILIPPGESVNFTVRAAAAGGAEGVHVHVGVAVQEGFDPSQEREPSIRFYGHYTPVPNEFHYTWKEEMIFSDSLLRGSSWEVTILLSSPHSFNRTLRDYHVNITNHLSQVPVSATVTVFASLCQYFHFPSMQWSTEGLTPTAATSWKEIVCLTEHLTLFGASLFVPPHSIFFLPPSKRSRQTPLAVITCCVLFAIYLVMVLIAHKLDDIDLTRVGVVPRCGQPGRYKYWVMVKTGWKRGSGTTAHIGISLYGLNKSGSRHLDKGWAFQRNSQDIFQVETDAHLGEIWKIRIWHDNTGLDPSWFLQHVIVWDRQTDHMYFFLVDDWLSVENEKNEGLVEKEVLAACPQELRCFSRVFPAQLRLGFSDWHVWLSIWGRSPHSRFTRVQRITCCVLAVYLFLAACALWYGAIGVEGYSVPLGSQASVTAESIAVGMVVAVVVFPIQFLFTFIFRKTRSKVIMEDPDPRAQDSQTVEMDVCLKRSDLGSASFLSIPGGRESIMAVSSASCESPVSRRPTSTQENLTKVGNERAVKRWPSCDSIFDVPDLLHSDPLGSQSRILKRKKALLKLGIESTSSSDADPLSFSLGDSEDSRRASCGQRLTHSEEDLLNSIVAEAWKSSSSDCVTSDSGRFSPQAEVDLVSDVMESSCSGWSDGIPEQGKSGWGFLCKSFSSLSALTSTGSVFLPDPEPPSARLSSFSTRIGVARRPLEWLFPGWVLPMTYAFIFLLVAGCFAITILYGSSLHDHAALLWLISSVFSFLTSFALLEPLKVVLEALRAALITKPVASEGEGLVEEPLVKPVPERIGKVRVPCGYGLLQAKEEARKVRVLRALMKKCLTHMLFLLVVLIVNYQSCFHDSNIHLLHTAVRQAVTAPNDRGLNFSSLRSDTDTWEWIDSVLLSHLYRNPRLTLVGVPRLWQESSAVNVPLDLAPRPEVSRSGHVDRDTCSDPSLQNSSHDSIGFWIWGHVGVYRSNAGCWRELGNSSAKARRTLTDLRARNWINKRSGAVFLEFTQYNVDVNLYVAVMLLLEFPSVRPAVPSVVILPYQMLRLGTGLDLPLALVISLLLFSVAFLLPELSLLSQEGASYLAQSRCWLQLLVALLSIAVGAVHFAHIWLADVRLKHYWGHRQAFTSFYEVALLARLEVCLSALLLTITMLKMARQLRFVRRWSAFGKTLQHALGDLLAATLLFFLFLLVYAQCGYLAFSATVEEFRTLQCALYALLSALHGKVAFQSVIQEFPTLGAVYVVSYVVGLLCVGSRFLCAIILHSYRTVQAEMYRPAIEPQDYEMIEFFVKRFKLWLGLSKTKEFRHKVKFEGMDSLISRSSGNSKRSCLPSAGTVSRCGSSPISSGSFSSEELALPESPAPEPYDVGFYLARLPSAVNHLLDQFDRVIRVMEDVCQLETGLEQVQKRINDKKVQKGEKSWQGEKVAPGKQLELLRTYSTFSESALARMRAHRIKVSNCNATDGPKLVQEPPADAIPHPLDRRTSRLGGPPISADLCPRLTHPSGIVCKWRPKSEEGQGCLCHDVPQRQIPLKRRAWQTEGTGNM